jgi:hypothetical protein
MCGGNYEISDNKLLYEKSLDNLYEILEKYGNIKNAIRWARKLNDRLPNPNAKDNWNGNPFLNNFYKECCNLYSTGLT